ncbi:MAG: hypothetical protein JSW11_10685 [Candidatus Heimdallarchaeota archaeon]|nr:MAG: hypothetical protein JSW11_10685 [Candidatus Heimdallarchaeota archaeon]
MAAVDIVDNLLHNLIFWSFLILILGGLLAASWLLVRLAGVSSDDMSSIVDKLSLVGFPVGILALFSIGAGLLLWSTMGDPGPEFIDEYPAFDLVTIACLGILSLVLILRPIKDFRIGAFISLAIGLLGAGLLVLLGAESIQLLAIVFVVIFIALYLSIKLIEDLYLLIAEVLSSPIISIAVGVLCIIQGILLFFGVSIGGIITFLLGG